MKKNIYMLFLIGGIACSTEDPSEVYNSGSLTLKTLVAENSEAASSSNPYDDRGKAYLQILDSYEALEKDSADDLSIITTLETIAIGLGVSDHSYNPLVSQNIRQIKSLSHSNIDDALTGLNVSASGKALLISTVNELILLKNLDASYDAVYTSLINQEQTVLHSALSPHDTEVLLTTFSIVRYSIYNKSRRKRKDRDWELSVGNVIATAYGAVASRSNAIISGAISEYIN